MRLSLILFLLSTGGISPLFFFACSITDDKSKSPEQVIKNPVVVKKDSIITLQMHVKKGERFSFGYLDNVFNFIMVETRDEPNTKVYERKIVSHKAMFIKDNEMSHQNSFYLIPGETYKITKDDSGFSNFEVLNNPKRTHEVNALKELRKHNIGLRKFNKYDSGENYSILDLKDLNLTIRDSLLKNDYQENIRFLNKYASINDFSILQKQVLDKYLLYKYYAARLNFRMKNPKNVQAYLEENRELYTKALKEMNCDSCFNYPDYCYLALLFAKAYVGDPDKKAVELIYKDYNVFFTGKTKDYLLYNLIKFGGMFNYTKPNPKLAEQFLVDAQDSELKKYIKETYKFLKVKQSDIGILAHSSGTNVTWRSMLAKHRGKVIYVDFWASWCGPCRSEMPASQLLKKQFAGKKVAFVYVSIDENKVDWQKASKLEAIDKGESYILIRAEKSELRKQYRINSIPRYFLIDKSGKVINANALKPSNNKIAKEIQFLL